MITAINYSARDVLRTGSYSIKTAQCVIEILELEEQVESLKKLYILSESSANFALLSAVYQK